MDLGVVGIHPDDLDLGVVGVRPLDLVVDVGCRSVTGVSGAATGDAVVLGHVVGVEDDA